mgnify:CR=1 FL=1
MNLQAHEFYLIKILHYRKPHSKQSHSHRRGCMEWGAGGAFAPIRVRLRFAVVMRYYL